MDADVIEMQRTLDGLWRDLENLARTLPRKQRKEALAQIEAARKGAA